MGGKKLKATVIYTDGEGETLEECIHAGKDILRDAITDYDMEIESIEIEEFKEEPSDSSVVATK